MKKVFFLILIALVISILGYFYINKENSMVSSSARLISGNKETNKNKNIGFFAQYNFENLKKRKYKTSKITEIGKTLIVDIARKALVKRGELAEKTFNFETQAIQFESNGKKISGMMNLPVGYKNKKSPVVIMVRGFAENKGYYIGSGSWRAADELARNGYITVSLDFLGFGLSDNESRDILEARFEKPISVIDLIETVKKMKIVDSEKIGIWAHSNGGQIAISVLEITGKNYPTVLWAPMTNPFPKSILEMIDDSSESSLKVKKKIEDFEADYDSKLYSIDNFYSWINSPILIHQGTEDVWCKIEWQEDLQKKLKTLEKDINLDIRQGSDHNLKQSWDEVIKMDVEFFNEKLK
jgi:dipeptidyl aminopeptidase/acylaminoacyl peptidase